MKRYVSIISIVILILFFSSTLVLTAEPPNSTNEKKECEQTEKCKTEKEKKENDETETKDKTKEKVVELTDKDLKNVHDDKNVNITVVEPEALKEGEAGKPAEVEKTKAYWQNLKNAIDAKIQKIEDEIKAKEDQLSKLRFQLALTDMVTEQIRLKIEIDQLYQSIQDYKRGLDSTRKELDELRDKARKAGVPPGWVR
ncbi:MAG: hypothetical protein ACM3SY_10100 [Candidatus Omnitrophota bacterium]